MLCADCTTSHAHRATRRGSRVATFQVNSCPWDRDEKSRRPLRASAAIGLRRIKVMIIKRPDLVKRSGRAGVRNRRRTSPDRDSRARGDFPGEDVKCIWLSRFASPKRRKPTGLEGGYFVLVANARERRRPACRLFKNTSILSARDCARARGSGQSCGRGSAARARARAGKVSFDSTIPRGWTVNAARCTESPGMRCSRQWHRGFRWPGSDERANRLDHGAGRL